ncbi:Cof-type HAD-IIB family hydrolase [Plantactinospora sp. BC1]|uniref:HAD family hydrolase n=1 Tax=Plantactinospora sp. BC1 TaxID=2108470 RepID=UPI000D15579D|nr:HAD family hydrolase [Plantactinospora sp. BC1]AVT31068.1 Cof-type HAD-IIB family hydrolase [Plantactinospora sp. BC1]
MGRLPRLVATDLDGTLLRADQTISPRTVEAISRISAQGTGVVLVTGRPIRWLSRVYEQLGQPLPTVCANGAVVYDPVTDQVLRADPLAPDLLAEVVQRLRAEVPGVSFAVEVTDGREFRHEVDYPLRWDRDYPDIRMIESPADLHALPAVKLLARAGGQDPDVFVKVVAGALAGLAEATHSSYSGLIEISAAGVTKAAGLAWYCTRHGVDAADVVAFGDMPNDVPMLTWVGRAVAVANAHPAVLEIAGEVTASNEEDGVAAYLEALLDSDQPDGADVAGPAGRSGDRIAGSA